MPRGRGGAAPRGRGRGRGGTAPVGFLARTRRDARTFRFTLEDREPKRDVRELRHYHPLVGVSLRTCSAAPYSRLPVEFAPCEPVRLGDGLIHVRLLEDLGFVNHHRRSAACAHVRRGERKRKECFGGVCKDCWLPYVLANIPIAGSFMPIDLCFDRGVLPADKRPSPLWPLFRASAPSEAPWEELIDMAAHGHLAPAPQSALDELADEPLPVFAELAASVGLPVHLTINALWRLFGTNEISQQAAQFEMPLVNRVAAWPGCIFSVSGLVVSRREWKRFDDLMRERRVRRERPAAPTIEYPNVCTDEELMLAKVQLQIAAHDNLAYVNIAGEHVLLDIVCDLIAACGCPLALTATPTLCHPVNHLLSLAAT